MRGTPASSTLGRRLLLVGPVLALMGVILAIALIGSGAQASSTYRVDVIFDTAKGIIPGQLVKIAGARVGKIKDVKLTPDYKARIQMTVDRRFAPFKTDASCDIQPEGLISENFVQCNPGTAAGRPLRGENGEAPTVPVEHTSVPVNLLDLFKVFQAPIRERFTIVVNMLGIGLAGRGDDLNELLARANPTLALTRKVMGILDRQRSQISTLIKSTDTLVAKLARHSGEVRSFIDKAQGVTKQTSDESSALAESIRRLPGLLDAARPALQKLDTVAATGTPVLRNLRAAAPSLNSAISHLGPFSTSGLGAIRGLGDATPIARSSARSATPVLKTIRSLADIIRPTAGKGRDFFAAMRDQGAIENLMKFFYTGAAGTARYDGISHVIPELLSVNQCSPAATAPVAGCSANYNTPAAATSRIATAVNAPAAAAPAKQATAPTAPAGSSAGAGAQRDRPTQSTEVLGDLLSFLFG
jgi:virulence factor Mce-like protein